MTPADRIAEIRARLEEFAKHASFATAMAKIEKAAEDRLVMSIGYQRDDSTGRFVATFEPGDFLDELAVMLAHIAKLEDVVSASRLMATALEHDGPFAFGDRVADVKEALRALDEEAP